MIPLFIFSFTSLAFAASGWNSSALKKYSEASSYQELFCKDKYSAASCAYYRRQLGATFHKRPLKITREDEQTLILHTLSVSMRIVRVDGAVYRINNRNLDLRDVGTLENLREALLEILPKRSSPSAAASFSLWITKAFAQNAMTEPAGVLDLQIVAALERILLETQRFETCEELQSFVNACTSEPWDKSVIQSHAAWKGHDTKGRRRQVQVANQYIQKLDEISKRIEKSLQRSLAVTQKDMLKECRSDVYWDLQSSFESCRQSFKDYRKVLVEINKNILKDDQRRADVEKKREQEERIQKVINQAHGDSEESVAPQTQKKGAK